LSPAARAAPACALAITGAALFAGVGSLVGGTTGWAAAGGLSLFWVAVLSECWRRTPAVEIDANERPLREIPRREMCRHTVRQSWSPSYPRAWARHGVFGALRASFWPFWAANHPDLNAVRKPFL